MKRQRRWWRRLFPCLLAAGLTGAGGCFHLQFLRMAEPECAGPCQSIPLCARSHVYIFLVHGVDPLDCANMTGVRNYIQSLGFNKTYYGQFFHTAQFERELRCIHQTDPDARFVLIGFSCGANKVRTLAQAVKHDGIAIDLLVYLGGNTLKNVPHDRPENACRIINILAEGCIWNGTVLDGAENVQVQKVGHFGSPMHQYTRDTLARELATVAASVPVVVPPTRAIPPGEEAPTPRPVTAASEGPRDEWDFLKPVPHLGNRMPAAQQ